MAGEPAEAVRSAPGPAAPPGSPAGLAAVDREFQALRARLVGGVSPPAGTEAFVPGSEPGHPGRTFQIATRPAGAPYLDPDDWSAEAPRHDGSWWPAWEAWLAQHSSGCEAPPAMGAPDRGYPPLEDAPGTYVLQR